MPFFPIEETDEGITICIIDVHPAKQFSPIDFTVDEIKICFNEVQLLNAPFSINLTDSGIVTLVILVHEWKAPPHIISIEFGIIIFERFEHLSKNPI